MSSTTSSFDFEKTMKRILAEYRAEVVGAATEIVPQVGREAAKRLRTQSATPRRTGKYAKGWAFKAETKRLKVIGHVYGKSGTYQIAHLLEYGHATRNGGRGADARPHIKDVEEWANDEAVERIIKKLSGGLI